MNVPVSSMRGLRAREPEDPRDDRARRPGRTGSWPGGRRRARPGPRPGSASPRRRVRIAPNSSAAKHDADRVRPSEQGDGDRVEADGRAVRRRHVVGDARGARSAPARPASRPATDIVRMMSPPRRHAGVPGGIRVGARRSGSRTRGSSGRGATETIAISGARMSPRWPFRPRTIGRAAFPTSAVIGFEAIPRR